MSTNCGLVLRYFVQCTLSLHWCDQ
uniref:Uncharacterized protein n=1 Tax=Arundo donax TaxID=35708 RepID=A0A0A9A411_ARUDO